MKMDLEVGHKYLTKDESEVEIIHVDRGSDYPICGKLWFLTDNKIKTFRYVSYTDAGHCKESSLGDIVQELRPRTPREIAMELLENNEIEKANKVLMEAVAPQGYREEPKVAMKSHDWRR